MVYLALAFFSLQSEVLVVYMSVHRTRLRELGIAVLTDERARFCVHALVGENV